MRPLIIILVCMPLLQQAASFLGPSPCNLPQERCLLQAKGNKQQGEEEPSLGLKVAWYGSEAFGDLMGALSGGKSAEKSQELDRSSKLERGEAIASLRADYEKVYFVTGDMDMNLYEQDCTFADPFVSFDGLDRFKKNLDNLGSFMEDVDLKVTSWEEKEDSLKAKWRFRCTLGLPWKPTLAASGGTEHYFNTESGRIERHVESWDIEPVNALKQLITPGRKR
ncbi:unnamed protein product [Chrysoparadoxa australica]